MPGSVQRPAERPAGRADMRKQDQVSPAKPPSGDLPQKDSSTPPRRSTVGHVPDAATPTTATPSPSRTDGCKGAR
ncbi:hypothetical protein ACFC09_15275 [Streptomyces sp. NPDC056161]|uniref:hypothetical protein n=1 Tax=Streptomyces sp. NPDC056161 TaxID=3345732 RepID=UPI0035DE9D60